MTLSTYLVHIVTALYPCFGSKNGFRQSLDPRWLEKQLGYLTHLLWREGL